MWVCRESGAGQSRWPLGHAGFHGCGAQRTAWRVTLQTTARSRSQEGRGLQSKSCVGVCVGGRGLVSMSIGPGKGYCQLQDARLQRGLCSQPVAGTGSAECFHTHKADPLAYTGKFGKLLPLVMSLWCPLLRKFFIMLTLQEQFCRTSLVYRRAYNEGST